jgi:hypothetical protein
MKMNPMSLALSQQMPLHRFACLVLLLSAWPLQGQVQSGMSVIAGDSVAWQLLDQVLVSPHPTFDDVEARRRYLILRSRVIKTYPYAKLAAEKLDTMNAVLATTSNPWKRHQLVKRFQRFLRHEFEPELRQLTTSEGQILYVLIHRETHMTVFKLIRTYRSWLQAVSWSTVATWYDASLMKTYDPINHPEDALIEHILVQAFADRILVPRTFYFQE